MKRIITQVIASQLIMALVLLSGCGGNGNKVIEAPTGSGQETNPEISVTDSSKSVEKEAFDLDTIEGQAMYAMATLGVWDGSVAESYAGGDGSEYDPYQIADGTQLAKLLAESDNSGGYEDTYFVLTSDIVLNNLSNWDFEELSNNLGAQWTEDWNSWDGIGISVCFEGIFDGGNHTIYGLYNNGLFSNLEGNVSNVTISCSLLESGLPKLGGIAGYCRYHTTIDNCHVEESIIVGDLGISVGGICGQMDSVFNPISNCSVGGIIRASNGMWRYLAIGGIVGDASCSNIENCTNSAYIEVSKNTDASYPPAIYAGGICGITSAIVDGCVNSGDMDLKYDNTYESVSAFSSTGVFAGGIVGYLMAGDSGFSKCNNSGQINYEGDIRGIISTKMGDIDTSKYCDYILCSGDGYYLVTKKIETVTDDWEEVGVIDNDLNWVIPLSKETPINPKGHLVDRSGYIKFDSVCRNLKDDLEYAGEGIFIYRWQSLNREYHGAMLMISANNWIDTGDYSCTLPLRFRDGYIITVSGDTYSSKKIKIICSDGNIITTDIYGGSAQYIGQYSQGVFFSYDGFYDIQGNRIIDLSEYAGFIQNQPYFENDRCKLIAHNTNNTEYRGEIDIEGNFTSKFTAVG